MQVTLEADEFFNDNFNYSRNYGETIGVFSSICYYQVRSDTPSGVADRLGSAVSLVVTMAFSFRLGFWLALARLGTSGPARA